MIISDEVVLDFVYFLIPKPTVVFLTLRPQSSFWELAGGSEGDVASHTPGGATHQQAGQGQSCSPCLPMDL